MIDFKSCGLTTEIGSELSGFLVKSEFGDIIKPGGQTGGFNINHRHFTTHTVPVWL